MGVTTTRIQCYYTLQSKEKDHNADALWRILHESINLIYTTSSNLDYLGVLQREDKNLSEIIDVITNNNRNVAVQKILKKTS